MIKFAKKLTNFPSLRFDVDEFLMYKLMYNQSVKLSTKRGGFTLFSAFLRNEFFIGVQKRQYVKLHQYLQFLARDLEKFIF